MTMGGGKRNKPVVYDILVFENWQTFYLINNIPNEITYKTLIYDKKHCTILFYLFYLKIYINWR